jgi:signal transduction histidine kinase
VALARALISDPTVLVLDEPTASLSVSRRTRVSAALRRLRAEQRAILLVTHDLDEAFALADRIVVLRRGRVVAVVSPSESHPDDVGALTSGVEAESVARRQLDRLRSLVEQLSAAGPTASLPLVVSATALALDQDLLCLHLLATDGPAPVLRRGAAVGLPPALLSAVETLPLDASGAAIGEAARRGALVVCEDLDHDPRWDPLRPAVEEAGVRSAWATPIVGSSGVLGTLSGFARSPGRLSGDRIELLSLYAGHAAAAIEHEQLFAVATRRNRVLESLRRMLESLAGPERAEGGLGVALLALRRGLRARSVGLLVATDDEPRWAMVGSDNAAATSLRRVAVPSDLADTSTRLGPTLAGVRLRLPDGEGALVARFAAPDDLDADARELLDDAARSLGLAIEREQVEQVQREAAAAKRSHALQRQLLLRLSHELRTPLTAIHGYATTLQQPDLTWDDQSTDRFLGAIARESSRMERLVSDLLDSSAIESGLLRLRRDWTDLALVLEEAARACVSDPDRVRLTIAPGLEPIWADHDRLEQVFVNLIDNAVRHGGPGPVEVAAAHSGAGSVEVTVRDDGPGIRPELLPGMFGPGVRSEGSLGAGLGLAIVRGIVSAHGGACSVRPGAPTTFEVVLPIEAPDPGTDDLGWDPADGRSEEGSDG